MNSRVYGIGETVFDIMFKEGVISGGCPGGSILNSMVSLGRLGLHSVFISEYGNDRTGAIIGSFLEENKIDTSLIYRYTDGKTTLALAFLENDKTEYDFYRYEPKESHYFKAPDFNDTDILLFGSFYSILPTKRKNVESMVESAQKAGSIIIYDPNFRSSHLSDLPVLKPNIFNNIESADIIRGSDEDFLHIFGMGSFEDTVINFPGKILVYTMGAKGAWLKTGNLIKHYPARTINPVSTVGAGDSFNAAITYCICKLSINRSSLLYLAEKVWDIIINTGIEFSGNVCQSSENYIGEAFATEFNNNFNIL